MSLYFVKTRESREWHVYHYGKYPASPYPPLQDGEVLYDIGDTIHYRAGSREHTAEVVDIMICHPRSFSWEPPAVREVVYLVSRMGGHKQLIHQENVVSPSATSSAANPGVKLEGLK